MRITSCHIEAFGRLEDRHFDDLDQSVIVVAGPNEAGKSTFFRFLQTMLYGVYPTDADKHEYSPRNGGRIEGSLTLRAQSLETFGVSRKLMSSPQGQLMKPDGGVIDLRNQTLPLTSHISQDVFEAVYALTLYDLAALADEKAWQGIQDRLLGSLSIDFIRPARDVIESLESEATALWRDDRRGKPASKQLQKHMRELRDDARNAKARDEQVRALDDRMEGLKKDLAAFRDERVELEAAKRKVERLRPLRDRLMKIEEASKRAGNLDELSSLPHDPASRKADLMENVEAKSRALNDLISELEAARRDSACLTKQDRKVLEAEPEIRSLAKRVKSYLVQAEQLDAARRSLAASEATVEERASGLLSDAWTDEIEERIESLSRSELRQAIAAYDQAQIKYDEAATRRKARLETAEGRANLAVRIAMAVILAAGGIVAILFGAYEVGSSALLVAIAIGEWVRQGHKHNRRLRRFDEADRTSEYEAELRRRRTKVESLLRGIPLPAERIERPDPHLTAELGALQEATRTRRQLRHSVVEQEGKINEENANVERLARRIGGAWDGREDVASVASRMEVALEEAESRAQKARSAEEAVRALTKSKEELEAEMERLKRMYTELKSSLQLIGDGDAEEGVRVYEERMKAFRRLETLREDVDRDFPQVERLKAEIDALERKGEHWDLTDEEVVKANHRLDELNEEISETEKNLTEARKDLEYLLQQPTLDEIESERARLSEEVDELGRRRDRLMLLASVVRNADQRFRAEHQPDVLKRGSEYLRRITDGRYERLDYDEGSSSLRVFEAGDGYGRVVASPLSQGTRDQIYLAVRLAIVDHLDEGQEPLPVFLDEVFVNWDASRRDRFYTVLEEVSSRRQVFIFTCHRWLSDEVKGRLSAGVVDVRSAPVHV